MSERSALDIILRPGGITSLFQPIVRVDDTGVTLHGAECLSRGPAGTNFESASVLFEYVRLKREESLVDRACISAALAHAPSLPGDLHLVVNVHASTLGRDVAFVSFLRTVAERNGVAMPRLTVDVVEHAPMWDNSTFVRAIAQLRDDGARIALDDVGLGQSSFKMLLDVGPDFLKLDRYFVASCAGDPQRRAVISLVSNFAAQFNAEVIAEGVETDEDAAALRELGVSLMQGFLFARPAAGFAYDERRATRQ
jgi:EAL domain-containing protein (putative c-di-GMP-specific phosphodiesterase class I)